MPVYKDGNNGTFYVQCYYRDARGSKRHKTKRGFSSEVEAAVWEGQFKSLNGGAMDMTFSEFVEVYASEVKPRIREHTWITKEYIINDKLVPFFGDMRMCDVRPIDVVRWQNELTEHRDADGKPWAPTYLRTVNNQLNAIFNHAERYYGLTDNPVRRVDKIGSKKGGEMQFWTKDEYLRFSEAVMDKQDYIIAKLTDTQVEVRPSVSVRKALRGSMAELAKEVRLTASYDELSESLQQRVELVMRYFLALGEPVDTPTAELLQEEPFPAASTTIDNDVDADDASIFGMGRG